MFDDFEFFPRCTESRAMDLLITNFYSTKTHNIHSSLVWYGKHQNILSGLGLAPVCPLGGAGTGDAVRIAEQVAD